MNKNEFDREREDQQHRFRAGLIWKGLPLVLATAVAILILWIRHHQQLHTPAHPERFLESTVPID